MIKKTLTILFVCLFSFNHSLIAQKWGKVSQIQKDQIIIVEQWRNVQGKLMKREITMRLSEP